jgi:hypothetical protein
MVNTESFRLIFVFNGSTVYNLPFTDGKRVFKIHRTYKQTNNKIIHPTITNINVFKPNLPATAMEQNRFLVTLMIIKH